MMAPRLGLAALALLATPACSKAPAAPAAPLASAQLALPALTGRVVDQADLLTPAEESALTAQSAAIERDTRAQYVIVTVPSLEGAHIEDYGAQLGRAWGVGHKGANDGVILLVAKAEHKVRIEVGYGLEKRLTDPFAGKVLREKVIPAFRSGRFADGIRAGSDAIGARLRSRQSYAEIDREERS